MQAGGNFRMSVARMLVSVALLVGFGCPVAAQQLGRVTGRAVEAETGRPLQGAVVAIQGTSLTATTDAAGGS
jgi:hypothetical protein